MRQLLLCAETVCLAGFEPETCNIFLVKVHEASPSWGDSAVLLSLWHCTLPGSGFGCQVHTCELALKSCQCGSVSAFKPTVSSLASVAGFKEQIYDVYRYLPPATQVVLISATLPHEILEMTNKFMTDPIRILVKR